MAASLVSENASVAPGKPFWVAVDMQPEAGWHTYWINPGDTGLPTRIHWQLPPGSSNTDILWPIPSAEAVPPMVNYGFGHEHLLLTEITPAQDIAPGTDFAMSARVDWLVCQDVCIPGHANVALSLPVRNTPQPDSTWLNRFADARHQLPLQRDHWRGRFKADSTLVSVLLDTPGFDAARVEKLEFFPAAKELVNHAAAQNIRFGKQQLTITQPANEFFETAPASFAGVLVAETDGQRTGYEFNVALDPQLALPMLSSRSATPQATRLGIVLTLALAFLGGLILNLMPCVFPVLSLKALSLTRSAHGDTHTIRGEGLSYTAGVVLSFASVALVLLTLRAAGSSIGWGFQLQTPWFVGLLAYVMFTLGLSLSGLLEIGTGLMGVGGELASRGGKKGAFFTGVLAVVVASPCTAPFMGTALGYAITRPTIEALSAFVALGLGMASPFLLLAFFPRLGRLLPKPGAWMETFKQALAFPMYATAAWLLWVLGRQTDVNGMALALLGLVGIALAIWLHSRTRNGGWVARFSGATLALLLIGGAGAILASPLMSHAQTGNDEQAIAADSTPYSEQALQEALARGQKVFVDMTADWCISCLVNEHAVLTQNPVAGVLASDRVLYMVGDWTNEDADITDYLASFGRNGVPLYVAYVPGEKPRVLPQILTSSSVLEALQEK